MTAGSPMVRGCRGSPGAAGRHGTGALPCIHHAITLGNASDQPAGEHQASRDRNGWDRMAIFRAYAKVLEPGETMRIYEAGLRACPRAARSVAR